MLAGSWSPLTRHEGSQLCSVPPEAFVTATLIMESEPALFWFLLKKHPAEEENKGRWKGTETPACTPALRGIGTIGEVSRMLPSPKECTWQVANSFLVKDNIYSRFYSWGYLCTPI